MKRPGHSEQHALNEKDVAYVRFRRFLFGIVARLSRQGFVLPPVESVDLIQSFFGDAWEDVASSYDPQHSQFEEFLCQSFVHFARPRIVCMQRWQTVLTTNLYAISTMDQELVGSHCSMGGKFVSSLTNLSLIERELLVHHLVFSSRREKSLAERHRLSLYRLREKVVESLGFLAKIIGQIDIFSDTDRRVVLAMWKEARSTGETADVLTIPRSDVEMSHQRVLHFVIQNLEQEHSWVTDLI